MRVLLSPKAQAEPYLQAEPLARGLAGAEGALVPLVGVAERAFARPFTATEISSVREALRGRPLGEPKDADERHAAVVGYVCTGRALGSSVDGPVIAVSDHLGLTWRSPLAGPNDDSLGPRFPVVEGLYEPQVVVDCLGPSWDVAARVVAGVEDDRRLTGFEADAIHMCGVEVVSQELVPVALLAAHLGMRLAAAVVIIEQEQDKGDG